MAAWPSWWLTGEGNFELSCESAFPTRLLTSARLGIELAKIMVLQYSNNESSISIGESVRDEDGVYAEQRK
jgi:ribose-phosphate pyrophosphokinase